MSLGQAKGRGPNFVVIFGPQAVGKMTVGYELARLTGYKLFHNHMAIDLALQFFPFGDPAFNRLVLDFRRRIFEETASSQLPGLIFTYLWALNLDSERTYIEQCCQLFRERGGEVFFVELEADLAERLTRNKTAFRLQQKSPKRDVVHSERLLMEAEQQYRMNSRGDFYYRENFIKLHTTRMPADEAARRIVEAFQLKGGEG